MKLFKKIWRSRVFWCMVGIALGLYVIPHIPAGSVGDILKFLWSQKWGIAIGAVIIFLVTRMKKVSLKYKIVRSDDEVSSRR